MQRAKTRSPGLSDSRPRRAGPGPAPAAARSAWPAILPWLVFGVVFLLVIRVLAGLGESQSPGGGASGLARVLSVLLAAAPGPAIYLLSAIGLARLAMPLFRAAGDRIALQAGLGLSIQLTLSQVLGITGLLAGTTGRIITITLAGAGLILLAHQFRARARAPEPAAGPAPRDRWARPLHLLIPGIGAAIMLVAACSPPGWLWDSEFGGYDALSYHLQLPQDWIIAGRIWPVEHNIYSYLPGYVESAFVHLASLSGAPARFVADGAGYGLLAGDGSRAMSCQLLSAGFALVAAWLTARWARAGLARLGFGDAAASSGAFAAGMLVILTPWMQVTGSLAYNEPAVLAMLAAALIAAGDLSLSPARRTALAAWLIGIACCAKPTALIFGAPPVALLLALTIPPRDWWKLAAPGILAGVAALAPWLIRNGLAGGNPVFPALSSIFGTAHWTSEQAARFTAGHQFRGSILDALRFLILPDPADPAGARHRGLMHPQWGLFLPILILSCIPTLILRRTRIAALILVGFLAMQLVAWLAATHIQSRFLMPMLIPGAGLVALALAPLYEHGRARLRDFSDARRDGSSPRPSVGTQLLIFGLMFAPAPVWLQGALAWRNFSNQQRDLDAAGLPVGPGHPNGALVAGPGFFSGDALRAARQDLPADQWAAALRAGPVLFLNLQPPGEPVLLVGDAAPFYYSIPLRYSTTWDTNPLARAMREHPSDPGAWAASIFPAGHGLILVDFAELERLRRSGWLDPELMPERIAEWIRAEGRVVQDWPGQVLFSVSAGPPLPSGSPPR